MATLFSLQGEVDGKAQYVVIPLDACRIEGLSAIERALSGEAATGTTRILADHHEGLEIKPKDRIAEGAHEEVPKTALTVTASEPLSAGSDTIHHWEVLAK
jgi:hypothetical protein